MAKFIFLYIPASSPTSDAGSSDAAWGAWFDQLGDALVDPGNPFGDRLTIEADHTDHEHTVSGVDGYSVVEADSVKAAADLAHGCPILASGGKVEVAEALPM